MTPDHGAEEGQVFYASCPEFGFMRTKNRDDLVAVHG